MIAEAHEEFQRVGMIISAMVRKVRPEYWGSPERIRTLLKRNLDRLTDGETTKSGRTMGPASRTHPLFKVMFQGSAGHGLLHQSPLDFDPPIEINIHEVAIEPSRSLLDLCEDLQQVFESNGRNTQYCEDNANIYNAIAHHVILTAAIGAKFAWHNPDKTSALFTNDELKQWFGDRQTAACFLLSLTEDCIYRGNAMPPDLKAIHASSCQRLRDDGLIADMTGLQIGSIDRAYAPMLPCLHHWQRDPAKQTSIIEMAINQLTDIREDEEFQNQWGATQMAPQHTAEAEFVAPYGF